MHVREGSASALYRAAQQIVKCDAGGRDVLSDCEAEVLVPEEGGVWLAIGKAREEVSGLHVLVGKVAASSGSCNYCHFLSITRQLELLKISN